MANTAILVSTREACFTKSTQGRSKSGQIRQEAKTKKGKSHKNKGRAERLSHFFMPVEIYPSFYCKMRDFNNF